MIRQYICSEDLFQVVDVFKTDHQPMLFGRAKFELINDQNPVAPITAAVVKLTIFHVIIIIGHVNQSLMEIILMCIFQNILAV